MRGPVLAVALLASIAAAPAPDHHLDPSSARRLLQDDGGIADAVIDGDLDLSGIRHPSGGTLVLNTVVLHGSLRNAPAAPLEISQSEIGALRAPRSTWQFPLAVEQTLFTGHVSLDAAHFDKPVECRRCRFNAGFSARRARFAEQAAFAFAIFEGAVDFSGASFQAAAFDGAAFTDTAGPLFNEADFAGPASFSGMTTGNAAASFRGTTFHADAVFRGCKLGRALFAPVPPRGDAAANPFGTATTTFVGTADFRFCQFANGADFAAAAFAAAARFDGVSLDHGLLDLRGMAQTGEIGVHNLRLGDGAGIGIDEAAAASIAADRAMFAPAIWRPSSPAALDRLAERAEALKAPTEGRRLAFVAAGQRAFATDAAWNERAAWLLQWPTANYTDLARPLLGAALAWVVAFAVVLRRGVLARVTGPAGDTSLFARVLEPLHQPLDGLAAEQNAWCPVGIAERTRGAAAFACVLVLKFGTRHWRPASNGRWRQPVLAVVWLIGFVLVALISATAVQVLPGLRELTDALSH